MHMSSSSRSPIGVLGIINSLAHFINGFMEDLTLGSPHMWMEGVCLHLLFMLELDSLHSTTLVSPCGNLGTYVHVIVGI